MLNNLKNICYKTGISIRTLEEAYKQASNEIEYMGITKNKDKYINDAFFQLIEYDNNTLLSNFLNSKFENIEDYMNSLIEDSPTVVSTQFSTSSIPEPDIKDKDSDEDDDLEDKIIHIN